MLIRVASPGSKSDSCVQAGIPRIHAASTGGTLTNPPLEKSSVGFTFDNMRREATTPAAVPDEVGEIAQRKVAAKLARGDPVELDAGLGDELLLHAARRADPDDRPAEPRGNRETGKDVSGRSPAGKRDDRGCAGPISC